MLKSKQAGVLASSGNPILTVARASGDNCVLFPHNYYANIYEAAFYKKLVQKDQGSTEASVLKFTTFLTGQLVVEQLYLWKYFSILFGHLS